MTIRYVGPGGSDSNSGLTWALRKLTLNGVEDTPVVAGDTVYVGPGVYRESLTVDVSGSDGNPITYIGDVSGEHTDGVGGIVRITGSNDDQTATRSNCIAANAKNYRTFQGIVFDTTTNILITCTSACTNWIIQDCIVVGISESDSITFSGTGGSHTIRRCRFISGGQTRCGIFLTHTSVYNNSGNLIENCIFEGARGVGSTRVGGITVKNCTFHGVSLGVRVVTALDTGQTLSVYNSIFAGSGSAAVQATVLGELVEDYNTFYGNTTDRINVDIGSNSITYPPLYNSPLLLDGFRLSLIPLDLSKWSQVARKAGSSEASDDFFGIARPATSSKKSWGAIQATGSVRETTTTQGSSAASRKLPDAGEHFLMRVPITNVSTTISIYCYREADYAGTLPQMIIRQPGQSDRTTTDTGSASAWNQLTDTFTPAALPPYVDIFIKSNNTATSGNYDVFFDTLAVS